MAVKLYSAPGVNFGSTSLNGAIDDSVTTITLNSTTNLKSPGYLIINRQDANGNNTPSSREEIKYTGVAGSDVTGVTRAADGSTARSHADGALVEPALTVGMWNDQQDFLAVSLATVNGVLRPISAATITDLNITNSVGASGASVYGEFTSLSGVQTMTNKSITQRVVTTTDDATAVIDCDITDQYELTAVANATTFTVTGTPTDGQKLVIRFKDAGVAKALTFTGFTAMGVTIPTTTTAGKWGYVGAIYNLGETTWHIVATGTEV